VTSALARADKGRGSAAGDELGRLAADLEGAAASASGRDASRLRALAETLKGRAAALR
jgi:hypothetical protein